MAKEQVLKSVEEVIRIAKLEIKKQRSCRSDQMRQLTGLVNAYTRLLTQSEILDNTGEGNGDPAYYDNLVAGNGDHIDSLPD